MGEKPYLVSTSTSDYEARTERVRYAVEQLRAGNADAILDILSDDVVMLTPIYPIGKPVGEPVVRGKAAIRAHLLERLKYNEGLSVVGTFPNERGHVAMLRLVQEARSR